MNCKCHSRPKVAQFWGSLKSSEHLDFASAIDCERLQLWAYAKQLWSN